MATDNSATVVTLHQPKPKTPAERAAAYRLRKKAGQNPAKNVATKSAENVATKPVTNVAPAAALPVTPVTPSRVTPNRDKPVTKMSRPIAPLLLSAVAFGLAGVGIAMNGSFAHGLGSTPLASWLFAGVGVAADLVALSVPACAARLWATHQRGSALAGWGVWAMTFAFAVCAGIGFASVNIADTSLTRASRVTPAVTAAQTAYADAVTSRDRECKSGTGKFCREREAQVVERRQSLDAALRTVEKTADPQTEAASKIVSWLTAGVANPSGDDVAMLRLILLALLPQVGGILLMIGRAT